MEKNKKNNVVLSILCLFLALACMLALLSVGEDTVTDPDNKDTVEDTDSGNISETKPAVFYVDGDLGYRVIGNQTVFFLVCENPSWYLTAQDYYNNTWYLTVDHKNCVSYEGLTVDIRYSKDKGVTWGSLTKVADDSTEGDGTNMYALYNIGAEETVYLSYCFVSNCEDPLTILNDLKDNVFDDLYSENITLTDGTKLVEYYNDFPVYRYNYSYPDVVIPSG